MLPQSLLGPPQSGVTLTQELTAGVEWAESFLKGGMSSNFSWVLALAPLRSDLKTAASAGGRKESWKVGRANARIISDYQLLANQRSS